MPSQLSHVGPASLDFYHDLEVLPETYAYESVARMNIESITLKNFRCFGDTATTIVLDESSYFRRLDLSARASYSSADTDAVSSNELFLGLISRTGQRSFIVTGPAKARRVVANVDFGVTVRVTDKFRLTDSFRFSNFRIPGSWS